MSLDNLKQSAANGSLVLHLDGDVIDQVIRACDAYIGALKDLKRDAQDLATYQLGFAELKLESGRALANAYQLKADRGHSSAADAFESHKQQVEEMKSLFVAIRKDYRGTEANNASNFGQFTK
ncbi:hypothetical protein [Mycobacteroides immunogenum]|jgi:hypothetical protein|uniref:Uncharacterized protein n=1 Tax=Mycobacteroides immunogenum TaxID=83262 RepID=A0A7V8RUU6_9MYCO|nr:hypothetical protein [Mycobacteroides immunogenum]AMT70615.1 hypothetical protein ABG82_10150 [Mycobacteroides immunogenum]ANO03722.1 hypothetical protein BAB75_10335 [Mycobacteroides immunogenum]KIU38197.1 hypothetical protein TL11_23655 [Mycobacteroides immunogenum]KPG04585.1 hypothetical protein AN909_22765 [Mycobacteroides immunogenum]KPG05276.1 hypothetical protein AN908_22815 [Mycobacteroides immunogenum]